jgi:three-Cys-motif partner protein
MYLSNEDHLLVRGVWPHSAKKSWMVSRIVDVVSKAMTGKRDQLGYVELYGGPGRLLDQSTGIELPGLPVEALRVRAPFDGYVFCDFDPDCVEALRARTEREDLGSRADVRHGDAKDVDLEQVAREFGRGTLVIVYLDPARPRDMDWTTVELLARELPNVDLIINLPVNSLVRAISGPHVGCGSSCSRSLSRTPRPAPAHAVGLHALTQRLGDDPGHPRLLRRAAHASWIPVPRT